MKKFDIYFCVPEKLELEFFDDSIKKINRSGLSLVAERKGPQMHASLEWAIPGLIVAYIAKSYFDGFLQEAGKDHYNLLKDWTKILLRRAKQMKVTTLSAGKDKVDIRNTQSKAISVYFHLKNGREIKLLFDDELGIDQWEKSVETMYDLVAENHERFPEDKLSKLVAHLRQENYYGIYAAINRLSGDWDFFDDSMLIQKSRQDEKQ